ncbi:aldehyde ferredoxin oxidoreductase N-terminal domain-containing protein [Desulfobacula sp.]|uniref:aldehyde ferredoxin oxidoreductase N-terminal domain-containing protein n=1 Tax=Desulfobacula sp. TaxID=2593537 RepID=UPI00260410F5|nr:aldehyde ferredoxin oxidoreductase N-terminal domain-containing protein [Desulfobacula sp.]
MLHGYGGRILRVDLSSRRILREKIDPDYMARAIGGRGLNSLRMLDELDLNLDPLSPENLLIMGIGPLTGSLLTSSAGMTISGKSPLTNRVGNSITSGFFGPELKRAGYDQVIFTGKAKNPCYLLVADDHVEIKDATHLWGLDTWQATSAILKELGSNLFQVAAIGPAGENLVKFANLAFNGFRMGGGNGMGCLLGSKNLKAIVVHGTSQVTLAKPLIFHALCSEMDQKIIAHDTFDEITKETPARANQVKNKSCYNCNLNCFHYHVKEQVELEGPEHDSLHGYSSRLGVDDLSSSLKMNTYLNKMGIDSLESTQTIGLTMECFQKGLLNRNDVDGLDFSLGNQKTVYAILKKMITREGVGDLFAEGISKLSETLGKKSENSLKISEIADPLVKKQKTFFTGQTDQQELLMDCMTLCKKNELAMDTLDIDAASKFLTAGTGIDFTLKRIEKSLQGIIDANKKMNTDLSSIKE